MHVDMTAVTIQSDQIVSNEVKDSYAPLQSSYRKKTDFLAHPDSHAHAPTHTWVLACLSTDSTLSHFLILAMFKLSLAYFIFLVVSLLFILNCDPFSSVL